MAKFSGMIEKDISQFWKAYSHAVEQCDDELADFLANRAAEYIYQQGKKHSVGYIDLESSVNRNQVRQEAEKLSGLMKIIRYTAHSIRFSSPEFPCSAFCKTLKRIYRKSKEIEDPWLKRRD